MARRAIAWPQTGSSRRPALERPDTRGITRAGRDRVGTCSPEIRHEQVRSSLVLLRSAS
jgi:hypothetical protein